MKIFLKLSILALGVLGFVMYFGHHPTPEMIKIMKTAFIAGFTVNLLRDLVGGF